VGSCSALHGDRRHTVLVGFPPGSTDGVATVTHPHARRATRSSRLCRVSAVLHQCMGDGRLRHCLLDDRHSPAPPPHRRVSPTPLSPARCATRSSRLCRVSAVLHQCMGDGRLRHCLLDDRHSPAPPPHRRVSPTPLSPARRATRSSRLCRVSTIRLAKAPGAG
jgi:hypothetical protein